jgi:hypothetical protein
LQRVARIHPSKGGAKHAARPFGIAWLMLFGNFDAALHAAASAFD